MNLSGYPDLKVLSKDLFYHFAHLFPTAQMHKYDPNTLEMW
jgi:hypothetical protein